MIKILNKFSKKNQNRIVIEGLFSLQILVCYIISLFSKNHISFWMILFLLISVNIFIEMSPLLYLEDNE